MEINLKFNHNRPIYKQIAEHFVSQIVEGYLQPGSSLPSQRGLALQLGINRSTVNQAYDELHASGLVTTIRGSKTIVNENMWEVEPQKFVNWNRFSNSLYTPIQPLTTRILEISKKPDIINLANGNLKWEPFLLQSSKETFSSLSSDFYLKQSDSEMYIKAREELSAFLARSLDLVTEGKEILLVKSIHQALLMLTQGLLNIGDSIGLECPSYHYTVKLFSLAGLKMVRLPVDEKGMNPEEIYEAYKKHRIKMIFVNPTLQNPTGTVMSYERRIRLIEICSELEIPIVEVDFFSLLSHSREKQLPPTLYSLDQTRNTVISMGGFAHYTSPNIGITWILPTHGVRNKLNDLKYQMGLNTSKLEQQFLIDSLKNQTIEKNISHLQEILQLKKEMMIEAINKYIGSKVEINIPSGGLNLWCHIPSKISGRELLEKCTEEKVLIVPGEIYGAERGNVRISFALESNEVIEEGIRRLGKVLHSIN